MKIITVTNDGYQIDGDPIYDLINMQGAVQVLKRPIPITACKLNEPITLVTAGCTEVGNTGDWLMQGISGELYICPADIFEKSYDILTSPREP
jgi:hypothetical protein